MIIETGKHTFEVELCGGDAARNLEKTLPQEISMSRWGDEFYGTLKEKVDSGADKLGDVFEIGDVALWPAGNALCIFFGPTPASEGTEPRMASPVPRRPSGKNRRRRNGTAGLRQVAEKSPDPALTPLHDGTTRETPLWRTMSTGTP
jgi:hypothetical protein